jgi:hypothetical protein
MLGTMTRRSILSALVALALATAARAALWVSTGGDDSNPGTAEQPLRTIERARDIVRTQNRDMADDITVFISGEHRLARPLEFGTEDSGSNGFNIVYTAAPGEHPAITGGYRVSGWTLADKGRNLWYAQAPAGLDTTYALFVNGALASRTRGRVLQVFAKKASAGPATAPDPAAQWKNLADVVFQPPGTGSLWSEKSPGAPPFIENAFELLGMPGEWYFDRPARLVYYTPRVGEEMATAEVVAPSSGELLRGAGTKEHPLTGLIFKGIRFEYTGIPGPAYASPDGSAMLPPPAPAVSFSQATAIQFLEDEFVQMGTPALQLGPADADCSVDGCAFGQISWSAVRVESSTGVRIAESRFSYVCSEHHGEAVVAVDRSRGVAVESCQFDHYPSTAILGTGAQGGVSTAANLITRPMVAYHGTPPPDPAPAPAEAGIPAAYRALAEARYGSLTIPRPPTRVAAEAEDTFAYVTWVPSCQDGGAPVLDYTVSASTGAVKVIPAEDFAAKGYAVFGDLENGHGVTFAVSASNRIGSSRPSPPTANVTPSHKRKLKAPAAPAIVSVTTGTAGTTVQITPSGSDGGSPVVGYAVILGAGGPRTLLEGLDVIRSDVAHPFSRTLSGTKLQPGTPVSVAAVNAAGEGPPVVVLLR